MLCLVLSNLSLLLSYALRTILAARTSIKDIIGFSNTC
jgi:hypothetical protein